MPATLRSLWTRLYGGGEAAGVAAEPVAYNGYKIRAAPYPSKGQYQTCGTIEKEIDHLNLNPSLIPVSRFSQ